MFAAAEFRSYEVHPDGRITFRFRDPRAEKVRLSLEGAPQPVAMTRATDGVWQVTSPVLPPQIYFYAFEADGELRLDPHNPVQKPNLIQMWRGNLVTVPGSPPRPWEPLEIPHGIVHHHAYTTKIVAGLPGNRNEFHVYTPPGYDPKRAAPYPVLYLLHGWSDYSAGWLEVGKAHFILDALIAQGRVPPMLVVMPLSYGDMAFIEGGLAMWDDAATRTRNFTLFSEALRTEILPQVEAGYHVSRRAVDRAISGLSMGGRESLTIGLEHPELFAWVGGFSSALEEFDVTKDLPSTLPPGGGRRLLWVACGVGDDLIGPHRKFVRWLAEKKIPATALETPGAHTYMVWRENLVAFAPLLFR
jgi:enterochelin esterase-like enzyme